jgi:hypothetical protein
MRARMATALVTGAFVISAVVPAAAGRQEPAASACKLLERTEIAAVFGAEVGRARKGGVGPTCLWKVAGGSGEGGGEIGTLLQRGRSARKSFELARSVAGGAEVPIQGLGRAAFFVAGLDTVYVLETKRILIYVQGVFAATGGTVDVTDLQSKLVALAEIAVERS